jgi:hypothetical protein
MVWIKKIFRVLLLLLAQTLLPGMGNIFIKEWFAGLGFLLAFCLVFAIYLDVGGPLWMALWLIWALSVIQLLLSSKTWKTKS